MVFTRFWKYLQTVESFTGSSAVNPIWELNSFHCFDGFSEVFRDFVGLSEVKWAGGICWGVKCEDRGVNPGSEVLLARTGPGQT